jgi:uncharacterized membrane protein
MNELVRNLLNFINIELTVLITSMLPIIELRGAIPVGISLGLSPIHAFIVSLIGSSIPIPIILFTIRPIFNYLRTKEIFRGLIDTITARSLDKGHKVQKYGAVGLLIFTAIPAPGTGVWTGSLIAVLLDIRLKWAFPAIFIGNVIAGLIVMSASYGFIEFII